MHIIYPYKTASLLLSVLYIFFLSGCTTNPIVSKWTETRVAEVDPKVRIEINQNEVENNSKERVINVTAYQKRAKVKQTRRVGRFRDGTKALRGNTGPCKGCGYYWHKNPGEESGWGYNPKNIEYYGGWLPAKNLKISVSMDSKFVKTEKKTIYTDDNGNATVKIGVLGNRVFNHKASPTNGILSASYLNGIISPKQYNYKLTFVSREEKEEVSGAYSVLDDAARKVAKKVHEDKIKSVRINPINIDSRVDIEGSSITVSGSPPSNVDILKPYFSDKELLAVAAKSFPDYMLNSQSIRGSGVFYLYPGKYFLKIKNKNYYYLEEELTVTRTDRINIMMSELGTKHRVRIINN